MFQFRDNAATGPYKLLGIGRLPWRIGRSSASDLRLDRPGVWDAHAILENAPDTRVAIRAVSDGIVAVNHVPLREAVLRNGDIVTLGSVQMEFRVSPTAGRTGRETASAMWAVVVASVAAEAIVVLLLRG
jgi:pSer/pThr/pTyr-binding forkhead associated (FHA) protein